MSGQDQIQLERSSSARKDPHSLDASPKTILVHVHNDDTLVTRLETALSLARAYSAHVDCLHVTPTQAYVAYDSFGGVFVMADMIKALEEEQAALRKGVEQKLRNEDVSWSYRETAGDISSQLVARAALADLMITGRQPRRIEFAGSAIGFLGDLIHRSRTPIFIPAEGQPPADPTGPALIAWDGSYEAANAVRSTVGMLQRASRVYVLRVEEKKDEAFPSTQLLEYLSRHGIHAELTVEPVGKIQFDEFLPEILMTRAKAVNAAYIVMGGYSHSRVGEYIFGGLTRTMLSESPIPIVIAH